MKNLTLLTIIILAFPVSLAAALSDTLLVQKTLSDPVQRFTIRKQSVENDSVVMPYEVNYSPLSTLQDVLQGRVAGVQVIGQGGLLAQGHHIFIRGNSPFTDSNYPLIIIDGINPYAWNKDNSDIVYSAINPLHSLRISDIESVEILKNGYASALYGFEASNGAIVIRTKKGEAKRPSFSFNSQFGVADASRKLKLMNRDQFVSFIAKTFEPDDTWATWEDKMTHISPNWMLGEDTNWQDEIFNSSLWHTYSLSSQGGTEKVQYYSSLNRTMQEGPVIGNDLENFSGRLNISFTPIDGLEIQSGIAPSNSNITRVVDSYRRASPMSASLLPPTEPVFLNNGRDVNTIPWTFGEYEPLGLDHLNKTELRSFPFFTSVSIDLFRSVNFRALLAGESSELSYNRYREYRHFSRGNEKRFVMDQDYSITFRQSIGSLWEIMIKPGLSVKRYNVENYFSGDITFGNYKYNNTIRSAYLNSVFSYDNRLYFNGILRNDHSLRNRFFDEETRMLNVFGSAKYVVVSPSFNESPLNGLSYLALNVSYGFAENGLPNYPIFNIVPSRIEPERIHHFDMGMEYSFNRLGLSGEIAYFRKSIHDMLTPKHLRYSARFRLENDGTFLNQGVEFSLTTRNLDGRLHWVSGFNFTYLSGKITDISENITRFTGSQFKGEGVNAFYLFNFRGVCEATGMPLFEDNNGEDALFDHSISKRIIAGHPQPKWYGGFSNRLAYGNFDIHVFLQFVYGNHIYSSDLEALTTSYPRLYYNRTQEYFENVWLEPGDMEKYPRPGLTLSPSTLHLNDGSYLRLKDVSLGYNVPGSLTNIFWVSQARIYVSGSNLYTITSFEGWNPDLYQSANLNAPYSRVISFGVQIGF